MKNVISTAFIAAVICIFGSAPSLSQSRNSVSGFVFNESREPVADIYVELLTDFYTTISRVRTRGNGQYTFGGLIPGYYNLKVLTIGTNFEEQTQRVNLVPISALPGSGSISEQVDFYLRQKRNRLSEQVGGSGVVFVQEVPGESGNLYKLALEDLSAKNDQAAFDKLKKAIEIFPNYYLALDRLGNEYLSRGFYEAAYVLLAKAFTVNKRSVSSALGSGLALFRLNQVEQALEKFQTVVSLDPSTPNGHLWLGIVFHQKKNFPDALKSLLKANELSNGTVAEVHWQLARVYKDMNRFDKSADELELFLKYNPNAQNAAEIRKLVESLRKKS